ncbi:MAG TPA: beta-ketoacyl-[acyl-carrier-protein] synthase family protein [Pseudomonadota bacterium]|nr:beta-ketoacyl-[acyl-carrier-protein] synthase family protein [Pseudomonadota bacterium]HNN53712.1 beta-ketoacyl-[acyl-carrier-protein] synthase family protein [Pseudomonadota bacterium]
MNTDDVVVTGLGVVSGLGKDLSAFCDGLFSGRSGIGPLSLFSCPDARSQLVAQAPDPDLSRILLPGCTSRPDRFGIAAALAAVEHAGLSTPDLHDAAVLFGTGTGGAIETEQYLRELQDGMLPSPKLLVTHQPASVTDLVARILCAYGPRTTVMTACSSSAIAIAQALDWIRLGRCEVALAGGAEALCKLTVAGFGALRATSPEPCQPFDKNRKGLNLGEGAAVLVLESRRHAERRGAKVLARLLGAGMSCDAHHMTAPQPEGIGARQAMEAALCDAKVGREAIGYINAHGTGTPHNDAAESRAVRDLLGDRAPHVPMSSIKSMCGHTLGAAGAIEAAASVLSLVHGVLPPTKNLRDPETEFGLDYIPEVPRQKQVDVVLSSSFAFGGNNAALLFGRA